MGEKQEYYFSASRSLLKLYSKNTTLKEKWSHFDPKSWVTGGTQIWLSILSR